MDPVTRAVVEGDSFRWDAKRYTDSHQFGKAFKTYQECYVDAVQTVKHGGCDDDTCKSVRAARPLKNNSDGVKVKPVKVEMHAT